MCSEKFGQRFDCVSAQETSDSAHYKFCNIINTALAHK